MTVQPHAATEVAADRAVLARLLDRFFRASTAVAEEFPGTGLGLSICQALAEGHGGRITVQSEVGSGTGFRVVLPLGAPVAVVASASRDGAAPGSTSPGEAPA